MNTVTTALSNARVVVRLSIVILQVCFISEISKVPNVLALLRKSNVRTLPFMIKDATEEENGLIAHPPWLIHPGSPGNQTFNGRAVARRRASDSGRDRSLVVRYLTNITSEQVAREVHVVVEIVERHVSRTGNGSQWPCRCPFTRHDVAE